jgi:glycine oxidase
VFDPGATAAQASSAAAGILVARDAHVFFSAFREFYVRSIRAYPEWLECIRQASDREVPFARGGDWLVFDLEDPASVRRMDEKRRQFEREKAADFTVTDRLPSALEGHSALSKVATFHFPGEAYVQNRDLLAALREACLRTGVSFRAGAPTGPWEYAAGTTTLALPDGVLQARQVLVAAGAWTGKILADLGISAPLIPVKGQLIRIPRFHAETGMIHFNDEMYLVPRSDGLVVGATSEPGTWNEEFDASGKAWLEGRLERLLPSIARAPLERWTGIRPRTADRLPWMGWLDPLRGWALCAGHYKSGISMAPLAATSMIRLMGREKPAMDLAPFDPWRKKALVRETQFRETRV